MNRKIKLQKLDEVTRLINEENERILKACRSAKEWSASTSQGLHLFSLQGGNKYYRVWASSQQDAYTKVNALLKEQGVNLQKSMVMYCKDITYLQLPLVVTHKLGVESNFLYYIATGFISRYTGKRKVIHYNISEYEAG